MPHPTGGKDNKVVQTYTAELIRIGKHADENTQTVRNSAVEINSKRSDLTHIHDYEQTLPSQTQDS